MKLFLQVIPAKAGIQSRLHLLDSRLRGNDAIKAREPYDNP